MFFYSFNPIVNLQKLFTVKEDGDQNLIILNGVRVLSIFWVALGHSFSFSFVSPVHNYLTVLDMMKGSTAGIIAGGVYAVDTFFFLSGFLTCYLLTLKAYKTKGRINWLLVYFHRYYRLVFPVLFVMLFAMFVFRYIADGPIYRPSMESVLYQCNTYWWSNLLFINNFLPFSGVDECIGWVWYLANDFQFFLVSPPIIYAYCKNRKVGYFLAAFLILSSMITNGALSLVFNVSVSWQGGDHGFVAEKWMYNKPWSRMGAYFAGGIFGFMYFEHTCHTKFSELKNSLGNSIFEQFKKSRVLSLVSCAIGIGLTAVYTFPLRNYYVDCGAFNGNCWSRFGSFLYNFTSRPFFVFGLALILMPAIVGRLRVIKAFLGGELFSVLSRLNYMVYLIH
jgi:hypothetical protein